MKEAMFTEFRQAVLDASLRPDVRAEVGRIYQELQQQIDRRQPLCSASGRCCRFEEFGHRLFVTTMEMGKFTHDLREGIDTRIDRSMVNWDGRGCPFQVGKLCGVHPIRPFGCRIFFCDPTATQWQSDQYEQFHAVLKRLHKRMQVPYFYLEWRTAIAEMGLAGDIIIQPAPLT